MVNLIPMAGRGNRFFRELYNLSKPFIPIMESPMFITAVKSFPVADKYIFLCLKGHHERYNLENTIKETFNEGQIIQVNEITEGPACTCLLAEHNLNPDEGLFIASCDYQTVYDDFAYNQLLIDDQIDVIIWTFKIGSIKKADPKAFAYCRTERNLVTEVVEKRTISDTPYLDPAVVGSFTYKKAEFFIHGARRMIEKDIRVNNEFYVGTSINQLIDEGYRVVTFEVDKFISFGNPVELMVFQYWQDYFDQLEDHPYSIRSRYERQ